jgi:four helix bundle protein
MAERALSPLPSLLFRNQKMTFEDLDSWRQARQLTREVYTLTRNDAISRDFGICAQIQRAAVSTMSNVAEGFERQHIQEKLQFYNIAHGSNGEVRSLTYVIEDNYPSFSADAIQLREKSVQTGRLLGGLIRSTESRKQSKISALISTLASLLSI